MPSALLPNYSARFVPAGIISSAADLSSYWKEIQGRVGKVFGQAYVGGLPVLGRAACQFFSGSTGMDDIYAGGIFFRTRKPPVNSPGFCVAQYDVVVCSLDGDDVREMGKEFDAPMRYARKSGRSDVLFPVLIGHAPAIGCDMHLLAELESDLALPELGFVSA